MRRHAPFLFLLAIATAVRAQDFSAIDREIEKQVAAGAAPGGVIVVVQDDKVIHARAFGITSVETKTPVTTETLFRLGSTTKMYVALATLKLADAGKLRVDQPIGELVSDLPAALRTITLEHLLTHTSGLRDDAPMIGPLDENALAERIAKWDESAFFAKPGEILSYANTGYALIAHVIARVHGKPFSETMDELVLRPAGLTRSTFRPLVAMTYPLALGHDGSGVIRPFPENAANYAPGSLFTTASDIGRFLLRLLNEDRAFLDRMATPRAYIAAQKRHYGYGLIVQEHRGTRLALHAGARAGHGSIVMILPKERVAVAIMANRTGVNGSPLAFAAVNQFAKGAAPAEERENEMSLEKGEAGRLAGSYVNNSMIRIDLEESDGKLFAKFAERRLAVRKIGSDRYRAEPGTELETFVITRDQDGAPCFLSAAVWALKKER